MNTCEICRIFIAYNIGFLHFHSLKTWKTAFQKAGLEINSKQNSIHSYTELHSRSMETHLKFIGFLLIVLALVHAIFPRYFLWKDDLAPLSLINRQMMYVHTFFVAFVVFLIGWLCLDSSTEIVETNLGRKISLGFGIFWLVRSDYSILRLFLKTLERENDLKQAYTLFFRFFGVI